MSARDTIIAALKARGIPGSALAYGRDTDAILSALTAAGYAVVRWPPTGDVVQACADEVNPYAVTAEQYGMTVEMVCDVIDTWMKAASQEPTP